MSKLLLLLAGVLAFAAADAQEKYPSKPLKIVVPFAPGGPPEAFAAHIRAEREKWGRLVRERNIVVN